MLFISKLGSLVVYLRNKLARTRKLPELPSQKPPAFPDGGLVYWTGKGKKQTKHNCSRFTDIVYAQVQVCAHPRAHTKTLIWNCSLRTNNKHNEQPHCISSFLKDTSIQTLQRALVSLIGTEIWLESIHRWCSNAVGESAWFKDN